MCFIVALNSEIASFFERLEQCCCITIRFGYIPQILLSYFCHNTNLHHCTDPKFVDAGMEQVSELLPVLYQGLKRRKCFQCLCEQLDLDFAKYLKMCNIFILMAALSIYMKNKPVICLLVRAIINLFVKCGNCDQIYYLVYI